jgi:hypothetical protein
VTGDDVLFEVETPIGMEVALYRDIWDHICLTKHLELRGRLADVQLALSNPDEVRRSRYDENVFLFYRVEGVRSYVCGVARRGDERHGTLVTAYLANRIKQGELLWPR